MRILNLNRKLKSAKRLPEIVSILARHGFGHIISQIFERGRTRRFRLKSVFTPKAREDTHSQKPRWWGFRKGRKHSDVNTSGILLSVPERLRLAFEELGPTFVKLGQVLSTRVDILSELVGQEEALAWSTEFQKLQRHAQPFDYSEVRTTIEQEFELPLEKVFLTYEQQPFAAASIAQVQRGNIRNR